MGDAASRTLQSLFYRISETDALAYAGAALVLLTLGCVAGVLPAPRAARIDPAITVRAE